MRDGHDSRYVAFEDEEHAKGKAMKNRSSNITKDARKLRRRRLNTCERPAKFAEEVRAEAGPFAFVPHAGLQGIEFCLRPNLEPGHLSACSEPVLNSIDDFSPRPGLARRLAMSGNPLFQHGLLPLVKRHLVDARSDAVPQ
jgi:hypothetical protein